MIKDIDFARLYREHLARSGRKAKPASVWDAKAAAMASPGTDSDYAREFVRRVQLHASDTVLDVGCGPGTIGLALAPHVQQVYGLDYSSGMLTALMEHAKRLELNNVAPIECSWDAPWEQVPVCDITVVSRASIVNDMDRALTKLNAHTRKRVYMTHLVGGRFQSREIAELLGRPDTSFPDHMYVLNMLYQRNIYPTMDYIELPSGLAGSRSEAEFIEKVDTRFGPLSTAEKHTLSRWYQQQPEYAKQGGEPLRWAFMSWQPN
ncbi:class I SAM-dependent methyltransferase [Aliidiomarina taiwanensis]|uniref:class I SAM-dependent methyltransferase n=1 Tax=Aliidiomarina taiwanensis TaxID=946228 RepID=UPI0018E53434|nr:class I SAM-dependent methyltransferase [Aliidiomarina taiwanensis]